MSIDLHPQLASFYMFHIRAKQCIEHLLFSLSLVFKNLFKRMPGPLAASLAPGVQVTAMDGGATQGLPLSNKGHNVLMAILPFQAKSLLEEKEEKDRSRIPFSLNSSCDKIGL